MRTEFCPNGLREALQKKEEQNLSRFHMPGHGGREIYRPTLRRDFTELPGLDDLHDSSEAILHLEERIARTIGAEKSRILVNGSTAGILAAISMYAGAGDTILIPRNAHRSVYHAALILGAKTLELPMKEGGLPGVFEGVDAEKLDAFLSSIEEKPALLLLVSPSYEGFILPVKELAGVAHSHGIPVVVDEAHGAHLFLTDKKAYSAVGKADIVIQSLHKTLPSPTGTALLSYTKETDEERMLLWRKIYETSSPSYLLMEGIEACFDFLDREGERYIAEWREHLGEEENLLRSLKVLRPYNPSEERGSAAYDDLKLSLYAEKDGERLPGAFLRDALSEYGIEAEGAGLSHVLLMRGPWLQGRDFQRFHKALRLLDERLQKEETLPWRKEGVSIPEGRRILLPMRIATEKKRRRIPLREAEGRISASFVTPYPPGIPLLIPGEELTREKREYLEEAAYRHCTLQGLTEEGLLITEEN